MFSIELIWCMRRSLYRVTISSPTQLCLWRQCRYLGSRQFSSKSSQQRLHQLGKFGIFHTSFVYGPCVANALHSRPRARPTSSTPTDSSRVAQSSRLLAIPPKSQFVRPTVRNGQKPVSIHHLGGSQQFDNRIVPSTTTWSSTYINSSTKS